MKRPSSKKIVMNLLAALAMALAPGLADLIVEEIGGPQRALAVALAPGQAGAAYQTFKDKAAFLAATGAQTATGELPDQGLVLNSLTVGSVTFEASRFFVGASGVSGVVDGDWTLRLPGPDIAISDGVNNSATEDLDIIFTSPVFAAGFDFVEPQYDPNINAPYLNSTFTVTLKRGGGTVGTFAFDTPNDTAAFVGVWSSVAFDRMEIRETAGDQENEFYGQVYTGMTRFRSECTGLRCSPPVKSDCSQDVTDEFNTWLATVPNGSTIQLARNGCYLSNGTILFDNKNNITIDGNGATIRASGEPACRAGSMRNAQGYCVVPDSPDGTCPPGSDRLPLEKGGECAYKSARAQLEFVLGGGLLVRDLTLQGSNFTPDCAQPVSEGGNRPCYDEFREGDFNVIVRGINGARFTRMKFLNAWGDGLTGERYWDGNNPKSAVMSRNVTVEDSIVNTHGRHGFSCSHCSNMTVQRNTFTNIGWWVVDLEVEGAPSTGDITMIGNTYDNVNLGLLAGSAFPGPGSLGPIVVRDNVQTDEPVSCIPPIFLAFTPDSGRPAPLVTIADNTLHSLDIGILVNYASRANVTRNTILHGPGSCTPGRDAPGVLFRNVASGLITDNTLLNANPVAELVSSTATVCGNRTTATGPFDQPVPCRR